MISERISNLTKKTVTGEMYVYPKKTEFDKTDLFLSDMQRSSKRVCEYIMNQEPLITEDSAFTGLITFNNSVEGDIFNRSGYPNFELLCNAFYNNPVENLLTFEWQHSVGNFEKIIKIGLDGIKKEIDESAKKHSGEPKSIEFLDTQTDFCNTVILYAKKCSDKAKAFAEEIKNEEKKSNLLKLSKSLNKVPEFPAESFYEAVLSLYFVYGYIPDSIGLIDRYLYPYYKADIEGGKITDNEVKEYLQELFLMLQARKSIKSDRFYRGGESHFCIGGYTEDGEDGFNELSRLVVEALMELPTWIPQISLRWTKKTPREVLKFMMDCERNDKNKRIAFVNDEPRIKGLMKYSGFSYSEAVKYTMMGCNEIAMPGGMVMGFDPFNIARSVESVLFKRRNEILNVKDFDSFFGIYEKELLCDLDRANEIGRQIQEVRNRDVCIVSNIFINGCIENARCITHGGGDKFVAVGLPIGITTVIDSLTVIKQFVYDEKSVTMEELCKALDSDWNGFEGLRAQFLKRAKFFGNDEEISNTIAKRLMGILVKWNDGNNYLGKKWIFGNLIGYNEHNKFFGEKMNATPDGRRKGEPISFGIGQSEGKDRNGLTSLLNSIACCDPEAILTGPSVTNVMIDENLIKNEDYFEKLVSLFEAYFIKGGTHFQLSYVSKEDLIAAKESPEKYRHIRVRVSGFSDYFVNLNNALQDEIIKRTKY